ncbi:MAG: ABC transporter permease [Gemmatimonadetes bacterium]|nr:ABC transporter permease [Gemmatimonadota bacterium]
MAGLKRGLFELQELFFFGGRVVRQAFRRPFYHREALHAMDHLGVGSVGVVLLAGVFAGEALAIQIVRQLETFGAEALTGRAMALGVVRDLGPVLTGLIVSGRVASSIAAELGGMVLGKQVVAIQVYGEDPLQKLVVPRVIALALMVPLLTLLADAVSILGGDPIARFIGQLSPAVYWTGVKANLTLKTLVIGTLKPMVFGVTIGVIACYVGLRTTGGTMGIGLATRKAVVWNSIAILTVNLLITQLGFRFLESIFGRGD